MAPAWYSANDDDEKKEDSVAFDTRLKVQVFESVLQQSDDATESLVGAIDQGTSSTRFLVFTRNGKIAASAQMEHQQFFPAGEEKSGWHEHNPLEIWHNTRQCMKQVEKALKEKAGIDLNVQKLRAIGITNQRETTIAWNKVTGVPYNNAIVWDDTRTTHIATYIAQGDADRLRSQTGLPLASYFAGTKVKWLLDHVDKLRADLQNPLTRDQVAFGTVDAWLIYQLTGVKSSHAGAANCQGLFATDVTNASRWLFMNLQTCQWDSSLVDIVCHPHKVPIETALPRICASSHIYAKTGSVDSVRFLQNVPIAAVLGDQQAALFGQTAFEAGEAKNTYGTGLFLMMNTGTKPVASTHGLLTTVAYQLEGKNGTNGVVHYALEGSVSHSGSTIQWLRDQINLFDSASESELLAQTTQNNEGLYFVPAFSGLFAPYWRDDARACIVGMTASHHRGHICRAALEAAAYQTTEVFNAIAADCAHVTLKSLKVDGGGTNNELLMQFQADMINVPVVKPEVMETTSIGAAFAAGLAVGVWKDLDEIKKLWAASCFYEPKMGANERNKNLTGWKKAVTRSLGWVQDEENDESIGSNQLNHLSNSDSDTSLDTLVQEPSTTWSLADSMVSAKRQTKALASNLEPSHTTMAQLVFSNIAITGAALAVGFVLGRNFRV